MQKTSKEKEVNYKKIITIELWTIEQFLSKLDSSRYRVVHRNYHWQQKNLLSPVVFFLDHLSIFLIRSFSLKLSNIKRGLDG